MITAYNVITLRRYVYIGCSSALFLLFRLNYLGELAIWGWKAWLLSMYSRLIGCYVYYDVIDPKKVSCFRLFIMHLVSCFYFRVTTERKHKKSILHPWFKFGINILNYTHTLINILNFYLLSTIDSSKNFRPLSLHEQIKWFMLYCMLGSVLTQLSII